MSNQAGLWAIGPAGSDSRTGRPTYLTAQLGMDGLDLSIPNQSHRDFETTALRSLREGNWTPQEPAPEASEPETLDPGLSAIDLSQGGSSFFGNLAGIASVVDISESDEDMGRGSDPEDVPVGPDAQAWEAFSAAAVAEDSMLNMEPPAAPALAICARRSVPMPLNSYLERRQEYDLNKLGVLGRLLLAPDSLDNGVGPYQPVRIIALSYVDPVRWSSKGFLEGIGEEGRRGHLIRVTTRSWAVWTAAGWHPADLGELNADACRHVAQPEGPSAELQTVTCGGFPQRPDPDPLNFWDGQDLKLFFLARFQDDHEPNWTT
jgi:hypothetical protein